MLPIGQLLGEGLVVGLAGGTGCLATCGPVLLPYLLAEEGRSRWQSLLALGQLLLGRLVGYLAIGLLAWLAGMTVLASPRWRAWLVGVAYLGVAVLMVAYGFSPASRRCAATPGAGLLARVRARWPALLPAALGLLTGLNLCPPFVVAIARAADAGGLLGSLTFFSAFFVGTSVYLVPLPLLGWLRRPEAVRTTARLAAGVVGVYFAYLGLVNLIGGLLA
ncbi:MAG TPA: sulfite exporter TauE/SafE family protein [Thermoanaerobaculaceae bacterium]|nr:sulfite exporter TauE/SafE family protein [Thermoanaerobaculaceae bacterium]HPS78064.1 sulfite exporter TauE/SafE family protein [Thermoanaerobaculaceae bacterium]